MTKIAGTLQTTDPSDTYPTHDAALGKGGLREVADTTARNAIPNARRDAGMMVFVVADSTYYRLKSSPWDGTNGDWETFVPDISNKIDESDAIAMAAAL